MFQISYVQNFVGGTNYIRNRVAFSAAESGNVIPGNWIQVQPGKGITGGMSQISSATRYVDSPIYDNDPLAVTGTVTGFKGYQEYLVANLSDNSAIIELGSNSIAVAVPASPNKGQVLLSSGVMECDEISPVINNAFLNPPVEISEETTDSPYTYPLQPRLISKAAVVFGRPSLC